MMFYAGKGIGLFMGIPNSLLLYCSFLNTVITTSIVVTATNVFALARIYSNIGQIDLLFGFLSPTPAPILWDKRNNGTTKIT